MGKTLMDGNAKDQHQSKSESNESNQSLLLIKMSRKPGSTGEYLVGTQKIESKLTQFQNVLDDAVENDKTDRKSVLEYCRAPNFSGNITPSAPTLVQTIYPMNNKKLITDNNTAARAKVSILSLSVDNQVLGNSDMSICNIGRKISRRKEPTVPNSPMTSFKTDASGFIEGLQVSQKTNWMTSVFTILSIILVALTFPFSMLFCLKTVAEYERVVVLRMGRLLSNGDGTKGPGLFFVLPCIDIVRKVELRTVTFCIPPQEVLTRDSVTVAVDAVVYYRICNPALSFLNVEDAARSTRLLAQTTLRNVLGTKDLAQILMEREEMSVTMQANLDSTTEAWGVKVERVEIKDVRLPVALQRAMAAEAEATREARARVIAAKGEHLASSALKEAAIVLSSSPLALQLRYLQTMCAISAEKNSTIIFPLPIDILQSRMMLPNFPIKSIERDSVSKQSFLMQRLPGVSDCMRNNLLEVLQDDREPQRCINQKTESTRNGELLSTVQTDDYDTYSDSV